MKPSLDINKNLVVEDNLDTEPKPSNNSKPYEQKEETKITIKESGIYIKPSHIKTKMQMNYTDFSIAYKNAKTKYEDLFPTFYNIPIWKKKQFENSVNIKYNINDLKIGTSLLTMKIKDKKRNKERRKRLIHFWQNFFKFLSSLFYNPNDKYKDIRINSEGFDSIYDRKNLGNVTIGSSVFDIENYVLGRFNQDFHHTYLTPKITCAKGELHLMPIYDEFNGNGRYFYEKFLERNQADLNNIDSKKCYSSPKFYFKNTVCYYDKPSYNINRDGFADYSPNNRTIMKKKAVKDAQAAVKESEEALWVAERYHRKLLRNQVAKAQTSNLWYPKLTHDTYERFLTSDNIVELGNRPWLQLRYALNYYADNYDTYEHGILIGVNVMSEDNFLSFTLDSGIKLDKPIKVDHSNLLIAHISKNGKCQNKGENKDNDKKIINLYYYENNSDIVFYIKKTLKRLVKLVKKKFDKDKPGFCLDENITYMAPSEFKRYNIKTTSMHGFWAVRHGICGEMSRYFGVIWGLLGSYFDNPLKCYLSLQRALFLVKENIDQKNKSEHKLVSNFKQALQRMMTVFNHYDRTKNSNSDLYDYLVMSVAKWKRYHNNVRRLEEERPKNVPERARNDANDFTKPSIKIDVPLRTRNDANTSNLVRDTILFPPKGGKKNKKTRKHRGIIQTGGNSGRLKKGYRYSGKRLKNGNAEIIKAKKKN